MSSHVRPVAVVVGHKVAGGICFLGGYRWWQLLRDGNLGVAGPEAFMGLLLLTQSWGCCSSIVTGLLQLQMVAVPGEEG